MICATSILVDLAGLSPEADSCLTHAQSSDKDGDVVTRDNQSSIASVDLILNATGYIFKR